MRNNFTEWFVYYQPLLSEHYNDFKNIFETESETPSFFEFADYCFKNTKQTYNHRTGKYEAKIYRDY